MHGFLAQPLEAFIEAETEHANCGHAGGLLDLIFDFAQPLDAMVAVEAKAVDSLGRQGQNALQFLGLKADAIGRLSAVVLNGVHLQQRLIG